MPRFWNKIKAVSRRCLTTVGLSWFWIPAWVISVLMAATVFSIIYWCWLSAGESGSTTIRNLGLVVVAAIGLPIAIWRSVVVERQATTAQLQADTARRSLLNERYQKAAEMLGSQVPSVRLGGIYALARLASEHPVGYHIQIMRLLCAFVRNPTKEDDDKEGSDQSQMVREDVQEVMVAIGNRSAVQVEEEEQHWLNLSNADLGGVCLLGANLAHASLLGAALNYARLDHAHLEGALLRDAELYGASLIQANLNDAELNGAELGSAKLYSAKLNRASLSGANLSKAKLKGVHLNDASLAGATLEGASLKSATLTNADLTEAKLKDVNLSGATLRKCNGLTQEQLNETFEASPDPPKQLDVFDANKSVPLVWKGRVIP